MLNIRLLLLLLFFVASPAFADVSLNFTGVFEPTEISKGIVTSGNVQIVNDGDNNVLRMTTPSSQATSKFYFPTKLKNAKNFEASFDYKANRYGIAGMIFRLGDWNPNKIFLDIQAEGNRFSVSTYNGKRYKRRPLCKIDKGTWYNFKVSITGKNYSVKITKKVKGKEKNKVVYDSKIQRNLFRINPKIDPHICSMAQWPGQGRDLSFFYDNISIAGR